MRFFVHNSVANNALYAVGCQPFKNDLVNWQVLKWFYRRHIIVYNRHVYLILLNEFAIFCYFNQNANILRVHSDALSLGVTTVNTCNLFKLN